MHVLSYFKPNCQCDSMERKTRGNKRKLVVSSPTKSSTAKRFSPLKSPPKCANSSKKRIISAIEHSNYETAFRHMMSENTASKAAVLRVLNSMIKNEFMQFSKNIGTGSSFSQPLTLDNLQTFSWQNLLTESSEAFPLTMCLLKSTLPKPSIVASRTTKGPKHHKRSMTVEEASVVLDARLGLITSILLFTRSPKTTKFIQSCIGVELWRQGCAHKIFETLNFFGISQSVPAARSHVDKLGLHHDDELDRWREAVESSSRIDRPSTTSLAKGYSVTWDNVQINTHAKHYSQQSGNKFLMWAMCFGTENRVATCNYVDTPIGKARDLSPYCFIPSPDDFHTTKVRMEFIVSRILVDFLPFLVGEVNYKHHIPHAHSEEMKEASNIANIGVVSANPSSTEGVMEVIRYLQKYIPKRETGEFIPVLANGDNLSVERMRMSRRGAVNGLSPEGRLEGLEECPQEFHKEGLRLQDAMDKFLQIKSMVSRGTLYNLKVEFGHKTLRSKVMDNFKHAWEMFEFATNGYVILLALKLCGMERLDQIPEGFPSKGTNKMKVAWVERLAQQIVDTCWATVPSENIRQAADAFTTYTEDETEDEEIYPFCFCHTEKDDTMVLCCNSLCFDEWFHESCIHGIPLESDDWYCSVACEVSPGYIYCLCHTKRPGMHMVQCEMRENCKKAEWYHATCIGKATEDLPAIWYCCEECALGAGDDDSVLNHSKALLLEGLNLLVRRNAVRDGDGPAMISHWKQDMILFWSNNHYKYFLSGCHLLAGASGTLGERLQEDLLWNRVVNLRGGSGRNIGLDLLNEFINNDFKEMLKHCHGRYTDKQVQRVVEMSGGFGRNLDKLFTQGNLGRMESNWYHEKGNWLKKDVEKMITEYMPDALWDYCPGRSHDGFENVTATPRLLSPRKMGQRIGKNVEDMDFWKELADDLRDSCEL